MAQKRSDQKLVVGGIPRAELLPPELKQEEKNQTQRRLLGFVLVLVIVITGAGYAFSAIVAETSRQRLAASNLATDNLLAEQAKYVEVRQLSAQVQASKDAATIGMATDIAWTKYLNSITETIAGVGAVTTTLTVAAETPITPLVLPTSPLEGPRIAEITIIAASPAFVPAADWLAALSKLPGYVDATVSSIKLTTTGYDVTMKLHVSSELFTNRFAAETDEDQNAEGEQSATEETTP